ncbi:MAG: glycosyltransferase family 4 protein [Myxococcales bacterium]|nr:glycosyltransferase family 4 protein [Myxococcales bacterium]
MSDQRISSMSGASPLTIAFVMISFDPEPGAQHGLPLARWLMARGHRVNVLTSFPQYPAGRTYPGYRQRPFLREVMHGVPILRVPIYPSHDTSALRRVATYGSFAASATLIGVPMLGRADVVFLYDPPPTTGVPAVALSVLRRAPVVHHIADMWPETVTESGMLRSEAARKFAHVSIGAYCKALYSHAHHVSVLSPGFKRLLIDRGVPERKVSVIYNWADGAFRPLPKDPEYARALGVTGRFNVVYAGNVGPLQNIEILVRAAALLKAQPDVQIHVVGTGPLLERVKAVANEVGATNVNFIPRQPFADMARVHALADVLVVHLRDVPFLRATIPSKTQVSMACGRPVLMAARGDAPDLILRARAGCACEPDNPEALAAEILRMHALRGIELEAMGRNGRQYYENHLSLDASATAMESLFWDAARSRLGAL